MKQKIKILGIGLIIILVAISFVHGDFSWLIGDTDGDIFSRLVAVVLFGFYITYPFDLDE